MSLSGLLATAARPRGPAPPGPQCYQRQSVDVPRSFVDRLSARAICATNNGMTSGTGRQDAWGARDLLPIKSETPRRTSVIQRIARVWQRQKAVCHAEITLATSAPRDAGQSRVFFQPAMGTTAELRGKTARARTAGIVCRCCRACRNPGAACCCRYASCQRWCSFSMETSQSVTSAKNEKEKRTGYHYSSSAQFKRVERITLALLLSRPWRGG